ncbi:hypothetical protein [Kribbella sp. NPDC055071]
MAELLLFPIGHYAGTQYVDAAPVQLVRHGVTFHELDAPTFTLWSFAHGSRQAVESETPWTRHAVVELAKATGTPDVVDELLGSGLLAEVDPAAGIEFARAHRVTPLMLGLGNTAAEPSLCGIGFLNHPVLQVSLAIYDVWQWSAMDDTLWRTCENAAGAARAAGLDDPELVDPELLLTGFLQSLHALVSVNAACVDVDVRLSHPSTQLSAGGQD